MMEEEESVENCLFKSCLVLDTESLQYSPTHHQFRDLLLYILEKFQECTLALPNLTPDPFFHSFTRYMYVHVLIT